MDKEKSLKVLGSHVAVLRKQKNLTQEQLADKVEVHRTYIGFIEQGKRNPLAWNLFRIAEALEVDPRSLFDPFAK